MVAGTIGGFGAFKNSLPALLKMKLIRLVRCSVKKVRMRTKRTPAGAGAGRAGVTFGFRKVRQLGGLATANFPRAAVPIFARRLSFRRHRSRRPLTPLLATQRPTR